jgi:hypothetical protein
MNNTMRSFEADQSRRVANCLFLACKSKLPVMTIAKVLRLTRTPGTNKNCVHTTEYQILTYSPSLFASGLPALSVGDC